LALQHDQIRRHIDGHRYKKSLGLLEDLTAQHPDFAEAWYLLSIVRFCLGHYQRAIEAATQAIDKNGFHFLAYASIGRSWLELDEPLRALRAFEKSYAINRSQVGVKGYIEVLLKQTRRMNLDEKG
jgi:tetratricopeptide (TPR) repeat protein